MNSNAEMTGKYYAFMQLTIILSVLYVVSFHSYLLFHALSEIASIAISFGIFAVVWNSRKFINNSYFLVIGVSYFFIGTMDVLHALAYKGMGVFLDGGANLPTQLWLASRFLLSVSFLAAPFLLGKRVTTRQASLFYVIISALLLLSIFHWRTFPVAFENGSGLTPFKIISEYIISFSLLLALLFLWRKKSFFDERVLKMLSLALLLMIGSGLIFTLYRTVTDSMNMLGHQLKTASVYFAYLAIVETGLMKPYRLMFRDLKKKEESLRESEERYRLLVELSPDAIFLHEWGKVVYVNSSAVEMLEAGSKKNLVERSIQEFMSVYSKEKSEERMKRLHEKAIKRAPITELRLMKADGTKIDVEASSVLVNYGGRELIQTVIRNITERKNAQKRIEYLSTHDFLTGLYNRYFFDKKFHEIFSVKNPSAGLIIADLDGLKIVNDTHGHAAGDSLIKRAGKIMLDEYATNGTVARIGGDEFAVILPGYNFEATRLVVEKLKKMIEEENRKNPDFAELSLSVGFSATDRTGNASELLHFADKMMYVDKLGKSGRQEKGDSKNKF